MMGKLRNDEKLRHLYMSYIDDGILDLFAGLLALFAGLLFFADMFWMAGVYVAIFLPVVWSFKEKVTMTRLRPEELNPAVAKRSYKLLAGALLAGLFLLLLAVLALFLLQPGEATPSTRRLISFIMSGLIGASILGGFLLVGYFYRAPRWYAYAALALLLGALTWQLDIGLPWLIFALGALISLTGTVCLYRFLRSHPVLPEGQRPIF
jgi:hypothetical protein